MKKQKSEHARAAAKIRKRIKAKGIKASVRSSSFAGGDSVRVNLLDDVSPAIVEEIRKEIGIYQYGHFDGMIDLYEHSNVIEGLPQVKFVQLEMHYSDEIKQRVWAWIRDHWADMDDAPELLDDAHNYLCRNANCWAPNFVWRHLNDPDCFVWQEAA
jgi:hypothetical protein